MAGTSYTRQSTIADGNIITAALFNNEFNQLLNAFAYASSGTTGHTHDGSAGQGAAISKIGDQDFNNKVVISASNNRIEFYSEVSGSPVEQVRIQDGAIVPVTDSDIDLGTSSVRFKDFYVDSITCGGTTQSDTFTAISTGSSFNGCRFSNDVTFVGVVGDVVFDQTDNALEFADNLKAVFGDSNDLQIYHNGSNSFIKEAGTGNLYIQGDAEISLGSAFAQAQIVVKSSSDGVELYYGSSKKFETSSSGVTVTGSLSAGGALNATAVLATTNIDTPQIEVTSLRARDGTVAGSIADSTGVTTLNSAVLTTADINGGTIDGTVIGGNAVSSGAFSSLSASGATFTTVATTTIDTTNLEVTNIKAKDGTSAGSIADSTGVVTLASSVLTTADINGGTADNVVIGGSTPAAGSFTTISATSDVSLGNTDKILLGDSASDRLEVYYDTDKAYLKNTGTGALRLLSSNWSVRNQADSKNQISTADGGAVSLYYDGNVKLATTDTGAAVTGGLTTSGTITGQDITLTDANPTITIQDSDGTDTESRIRQVTGTLKLESRNGTGHGAIELETRNSSLTKTRFKIGTNGDSNFYDDDGSTIGMKWDASASRLGIGTSSPTQAIDVVGSVKTTTGIVFSDEGQSGATSTSNTLDGYEEGTYTPVYKGATTDPTYDSDSHTAGRYTKIGRVVHVVGRVRTDAGSSPSQGAGQLEVSLPFAVSDDTGTVDKQFGVLTVGEAKSFLDNNFPSTGWASRGTSSARLIKRNEAEQQTLTLNTTDALDLTGDNKNDLVFSITYFTDA